MIQQVAYFGVNVTGRREKNTCGGLRVDQECGREGDILYIKQNINERNRKNMKN